MSTTGSNTPTVDDGEVTDVSTTEDSIEQPNHNDDNYRPDFSNRDIFWDANLQIILGLVFIYLLVFFVMGSYSQLTGQYQSSSLNGIFNLLSFLFVFSFLFYKYGFANLSTVIDIYNNNTSLFSTFIFMICYKVVFFFLPFSTGKPLSLLFIEFVTWLLFTTLLIHNFLKFFLNIDLPNHFFDLNVTKSITHPDETQTTIKPSEEEEVFNISGNAYTFDDAQAVCKVNNARLATYDEIETAYTDGAEWCNYGWSADQMAFFPTQKKTWDELQKNDTAKHSCGRPGVNGGYFQNPNIKFGANCFGVKPAANATALSALNEQHFPKTEGDKTIEEKAALWKDGSSNISAFNKKKWSRY